MAAVPLLLAGGVQDGGIVSIPLCFVLHGLFFVIAVLGLALPVRRRFLGYAGFMPLVLAPGSERWAAAYSRWPSGNATHSI